MRFRLACSTLVFALTLWLPALGQVLGQQAVPKVPAGVILVKGAWSSASDAMTPVPEGAAVANNLFHDQYFGMTYPLPRGWIEKYKGPPPSDTGRYVLAQLSPDATFQGSAQGSILITAQDLFFTPVPVSGATGLINDMKDHLQAGYKLETPPAQTRIAGRSFTSFSYWSPVAQLHWFVFATQIRCHALQIVITSRDTKLLEDLTRDMNKMKLSPEADPTGGATGGTVPVCIQDYAQDENMIARADPVFTELRFNLFPSASSSTQKAK